MFLPNPNIFKKGLLKKVSLLKIFPPPPLKLAKITSIGCFFIEFYKKFLKAQEKKLPLVNMLIVKRVITERLFDPLPLLSFIGHPQKKKTIGARAKFIKRGLSTQKLEKFLVPPRCPMCPGELSIWRLFLTLIKNGGKPPLMFV